MVGAQGGDGGIEEVGHVGGNRGGSEFFPLELYGGEQRLILGAHTFRAFSEMLASSTEDSEVRDPWVTRLWQLPTTVVSTTLEDPLDWPYATVVSGDAVFPVSTGQT